MYNKIIINLADIMAANKREEKKKILEIFYIFVKISFLLIFFLFKYHLMLVRILKENYKTFFRKIKLEYFKVTL